MKPSPQNKRPILMSAGYAVPTPTEHFYVETRECVVPGDRPGTEDPAWEHVYECTATGERRRFGLEERRQPSWLGDDGSN